KVQRKTLGGKRCVDLTEWGGNASAPAVKAGARQYAAEDSARAYSSIWLTGRISWESCRMLNWGMLFSSRFSMETLRMYSFRRACASGSTPRSCPAASDRLSVDSMSVATSVARGTPAGESNRVDCRPMKAASATDAAIATRPTAPAHEVRPLAFATALPRVSAAR